MAMKTASWFLEKELRLNGELSTLPSELLLGWLVVGLCGSGAMVFLVLGFSLVGIVCHCYWLWLIMDVKFYMSIL